jgi:hypothetical protein
MSRDLPPEVRCLPTKTPAPSFEMVLKITTALVAVYFMVSAWDDFLDEAIRNYFGLHDTLEGRLFRALVASLIAVTVLMVVQIHIDDLMGIVLHD